VQHVRVPVYIYVCVCVCVCGVCVSVSVYSNLTPPHKKQIYYTIGNALILQRISNNMTRYAVTEVVSEKNEHTCFPTLFTR